MSIKDLKSIIPSYFKDVWYLNPKAIWDLKSTSHKTNSSATTDLSVYKHYYD